MISLGVCTDITNINKLAQIGFDYLEGNLSRLEAMSDAEFSEVCALVDDAPIKVEACNCLLPSTLKLVGDEVDTQALKLYFDKALSRAKRLGVKLVVFGSGNSRRVPEGFDTGKAWRQIADFLRLIEVYASEYDISVAIEPLRAGECNILNYVSEATLLASLLRLKHVGVLGDTYHMALGSEPFSALQMAGQMLKHIHVANAIGRRYPKLGDGEKYSELFDTLKRIDYEGRVSVEGGCDEFERDAKAALEALKAARG